jgi:signal transduction histidine kinase
VAPGIDWRPTVAETAARSRAGGIRVRVTATAVVVVGTALVLAAFAMVAFVDRSLAAQVGDEAALRAQQLADAGVADGATVPVADPEEEFVQVLDGTTVVASSHDVAGLPALATPETEQNVRLTVSTGAGPSPFIATAEPMDTPTGRRTVVVGLNIDDVTEAREVVAVALAIGVPILLVVVGLVTWWMVGRTLRPVEEIRGEVELISSRELGRRVPASGRDDEIGRLAATMNRMLGRLERGQERRRRFVSDAAHELRSPVAAIRQHAEVAVEHPESTDVRELAEVVLTEDERLQHLVEDLLLLARIDERAPDLEEIDLDDVVLAEAERLRGTTSIRLDTRGVSAGRVRGERASLERVVRNLVDNAARHARERTAISVAELDGHVVLSVEDDGPGIDPEDRQRALEPFVRLDGARDRRTGGTGLGLSIVNDVTHAHGGSIDLGDSPLGGLRVRIELPSAG